MTRQERRQADLETALHWTATLPDYSLFSADPHVVKVLSMSRDAARRNYPGYSVITVQVLNRWVATTSSCHHRTGWAPFSTGPTEPPCPRGSARVVG